MPDNNIAAQNNAVGKWFADTYRQAKARYVQLIRSPERSGDGLDTFKYRTKQTYGETDSGGFGFRRYLIYRHKGAGQGFAGSKGSTWYDKSGNHKQTNAKSLGKMNTGNRKAAEWLNPVLDEQVPKLADIVAGFKSDMAVKAIQIK